MSRRSTLRITFARACVASVFTAFGFAAPSSSGCEAIVTDEIPAFRCTGIDLRSCPDGEYCNGSGCTACEARDICDGYDNDCDGKIDNGALSDSDGDGYSLCGRIDTATGKEVGIDCDDSREFVHPNATEVCNGKDDDCDGVVDNTDRVCTTGSVCAPALEACVDLKSACSQIGCLPSEYCDTGTQKCARSTFELGQVCASNRACKSGICGDDSLLTSAVTKANGGSICTTPCCSSSDCPQGFVCFAPGSGGNFCVHKSSFGITATLGLAAGGASCSRASDCRSGLCLSSACVDTCCSSAECSVNGAGTQTTCTLKRVRSRDTFVCAVPSGTRKTNEVCDIDSQCVTGVCANFGTDIAPNFRCAARCCGTSACGTLPNASGGTNPIICVNDPAGNAISPICDYPAAKIGTKKLGDTCASATECASALCNTLLHKCTDACCTDADCSSAGWVCRPGATEAWLRCTPP